jgi:solute:Na+ symporter, SSS family
MALVDYVIVALYLGGMITVGLWMKNRAAQGIDSYFLGNKSLPWWALGASGMSSNLDISGTMIIVALVYALGAKGFYIELRGGVVLIMAFLMVYMGKWNRRSNVMTLAEWMSFRFGHGMEGKLARLVTAITAIIFTIAMVTFFAIGGGKFLDKFLGIPSLWGLPSEFIAATILITLAMIYTVASGLYGVVWTDVFQGILIFGAIVYIAARAFSIDLPESFLVSMPMKDGGFQSFPISLAEWSSLMPRWTLDIDPNSSYSMYNLFGIAMFFYLLKVVYEGSGGATNYMAQRYFAAKDDREAGLLSLFWTGLLSFRWVFVAALAIWGISLGAEITDPEMVLPTVVATLPVGIKGFLIAGLMAAAMSTFDSTVNAGAAYWVKDIYSEYINPNANEKSLMRQSYLSSILIVVIGLGLMLVVKDINEVWGWITMSVSAGMLIPFVMRWYWWRVNGYGYMIGLAAGTLAAIIWKIVTPATIADYYSFLFASTISLVGVIIGTLVTKPTDDKVVEDFYRVTKPFGFWKKYKARLSPQEVQDLNAESRNDIRSLMMAIPWQLSLFLFMMSFMLKSWLQTAVLAVILISLSIGLYFNWYKKLSTSDTKGE